MAHDVTNFVKQIKATKVFSAAICEGKEAPALKHVFTEIDDSTDYIGKIILMPISGDTLESTRRHYNVEIKECSRFIISPKCTNIKNTYKRLEKIFRVDFKKMNKDVYNRREELYILYVPSKGTIEDITAAVEKAKKTFKGDLNDEDSRRRLAASLISQPFT